VVTVARVRSESDRTGPDEPRNVERIRDAALKSFATNGTAGTSLRTVAAAAGVSLGLVQHHFATKAGLIKAVDDYVLALVISLTSAPISDPPADSIAEVGSRVTRIIAEQPDIADYVGRALVDGSPLGTTIFDALVAFGTAGWNQRTERSETRPTSI
jgi:AcrR family transcriptional regulator